MRRPTRHRLAAALGVLVALGLTACGPSSGPHPQGPSSGTPAEPEIVARYADDVVVSIHTSGGMGAPGRPVPDYEVREDGVVFLGTDDGLGVDTFTLTEAGLDRVRDAFASVSLADDDYAESDWTDQPVTSVYATLGGRPEAIGVYGFGFDDEVDDPDWDRLDDAIGILEDLADTTAVGQEVNVAAAPYRPAEVALLLTPTDDSSGKAWPFTRPLHRADLQWAPNGAACVVLSGRDVVSLEAMTADHGNGDLTWTSGAPAGSGVPPTVKAEIRPTLRGAASPCTSEPSDDVGVGRFYDAALGAPTTWTGLAPALTWRTPTPFDLIAAEDDVLAAAESATGLDANQGDLSSYETQWIVGATGESTYVEVIGTYPEKYRDDNPDFPVTWQVRIDLATGTAMAAEVDGQPVNVT